MRKPFSIPAVVWWTLAAVALVGQALDIATTALGGGVEANPLGAFLMRNGGWPLLIGSKLALALALGALLIAFAQTPDAWAPRVKLVALGAAVLLVLAMSLIAGNNVAIWLITAHLLPWQ